MADDPWKQVPGEIAGSARDEILSGLVDAIGDTAKEILQERHGGGPTDPRAKPFAASKALPQAITSDELDAQIPAEFPDRVNTSQSPQRNQP